MRIKHHRAKKKIFRKSNKNKAVKKLRKFSFKKLFLITTVLIISGLSIYSIWFLPSVKNADVLSFPESTIIYSREALDLYKKDPKADLSSYVLYTIHGDENRNYVPLEEISPWIPKATLAIEDSRFRSHFGVDILGLANAVLGQMGLRSKRGGSTITQQLVKNTFLTRERTFSRKFNEILLSLKVEWEYSKDEILELYLNKIDYGSNASGVEAAAQKFFGKSSRNLSIAEAAILAGLPKAPTTYSPYGSNKDALMGYFVEDEVTGERIYKKGRKDLVLQRMLDLELITQKQFQQAWIEANQIVFKSSHTEIKAPHFVFLVRQKLEEKYGKEFLKQGGLRIFTTLSSKLQNTAEEIVALKSDYYRVNYGAKNIAMTSIDTDTGEILAYIGGSHFFDIENDGQVDILTSKRQPGSSFKPFVYATAFMNGLTPGSVIFDVKTDFGGYSPNNYDGIFAGPVSVRESLNRSLNIAAVKAAYIATPQKIMETIKSLGVLIDGTAEDHQVGLGVGVAEVQPLSMINAYQVFATDGSYHDPTVILEIQDATGKILEEFDPEKTKHQGLDAEISGLVRNILTDETTRPTTDGFSWNNLLQLDGYNNGAKTGTTNRHAKNPDFNKDEPESDENSKTILVPGDAWTIGFTPHLVTGVWVGNTRGESMVAGATGLSVAAPIWKRFMDQAHKILVENGADKKKLYNEPKPLEVRKINKFSGKLASDLTPPKLVVEEVFASFNLPTEIDDTVQIMEIDKRTGHLADEFTPSYAKEEKHVLVLKSIRPDLENWQKPVDEWLTEHPSFATSLGVITEEPEEDSIRNFGSTFATNRDNRAGLMMRYNANGTNAPQIEIISPRENGILSIGLVEVKVSATAKFGIDRIEFYLDDNLVDKTVRWPYTGKFKISTNIDKNKPHKLTVVLFDRAQNMAEVSREIKVGADIRGPEITFLGPIGNQKIAINSQIKVLADIQDYESVVKKVEFYLDEQLISTKEKAPFSSYIKTEGNLGKHKLMIKAWDIHLNENTKTIPLIYTREQFSRESEASISKIIPYRNSVSINLSLPNHNNLEYVEIFINLNRDTLFSEKIQNPAQNIQIQVPKMNLKKMATIQLFTKEKNNKKVKEAPQKKMKL